MRRRCDNYTRCLMVKVICSKTTIVEAIHPTRETALLPSLLNGYLEQVSQIYWWNCLLQKYTI